MYLHNFINELVNVKLGSVRRHGHVQARQKLLNAQYTGPSILDRVKQVIKIVYPLNKMSLPCKGHFNNDH